MCIQYTVPVTAREVLFSELEEKWLVFSFQGSVAKVLLVVAICFYRYAIARFVLSHYRFCRACAQCACKHRFQCYLPAYKSAMLLKLSLIATCLICRSNNFSLSALSVHSAFWHVLLNTRSRRRISIIF